MTAPRLFNVLRFLQPSDDEPIRSVMTQSADAVVVAWYVKPGQRISSHVHPHGQDTWTILSGTGEYFWNGANEHMHISPGNVVVAHTGEVHGVLNTSSEPLVIVSVVSPPEAGYERI